MRTPPTVTITRPIDADTLTDVTPVSPRSPFSTDYYVVTPVSPLRFRGMPRAIPVTPPSYRGKPRNTAMYCVTKLDLVAVLVALCLAAAAGVFWATLAHGGAMAEAEARIAKLTTANATLQEANDELTNEVCNAQ